MKKFPLLILFVSPLFFTAARAQQATKPTTPVKGAMIAWDAPIHDFGDIKQGDKVEREYTFTNTGSEPLVITNISVTCGCTTPKGWPREPIPPQGKSSITVAFDSGGKYGKQNKVVKVISNAVNSDAGQVSFTANVTTK